MATGNGTSGLRRADAVLVDAILDLAHDLKVEVVRLEGLAMTIVHRRRVTDRSFRQEFLASIRRIGERHLQAADEVEKKTASG